MTGQNIIDEQIDTDTLTVQLCAGSAESRLGTDELVTTTNNEQTPMIQGQTE